MTNREFLNFIFSNKSIIRIYHRKESKNEIIREIANKLTHNDDIRWINQDVKNFTGMFIPNTDNFTANLLRRNGRKSFSLHRFISIYGVIKEEHDKVSIEITYRQSRLFKTHKVIWTLLLLFMIYQVLSISNEINFSIIACLFIVITFGIILKAYQSILKRQVEFTQMYLIYNKKE